MFSIYNTVCLPFPSNTTEGIYVQQQWCWDSVNKLGYYRYLCSYPSAFELIISLAD